MVVRETRRQSISSKMSMNFVIDSLLCECVTVVPGVLRPTVPNSTGKGPVGSCLGRSGE
jgi:hypothetical protein